jgi:hypothetical protein
VHRPAEGVFERGSNVLEYWLANSEGFSVAHPDGKERVTAVVIDPETLQARSLVVRRSRRRTHVVAAARIAAVDPHGRVLYVTPRRRRGRAIAPSWRTAAPALGAARRLRSRTQVSARAGARVGVAAAAHARAALPVLRAIGTAYAVYAAAVAAAWFAAAREATLRGRWMHSSPRFSTKRVRRSPAARSRTPGR